MTRDAVNEATRREWRELGFFYDRDDQARAWRVVGSSTGLLGFADLLVAYVGDPANARISDHEHYGPYMYLKVMTWPEPSVDSDGIRGPLSFLRSLAALIHAEVRVARQGDTIRVRDSSIAKSPYALILEVRGEHFDPADEDPMLRT